MPRKPAEPVADRIRRRVIINPETGCWDWQGAKDSGGYGRISRNTGKFGGERVLTHRAAYEAFVGPIPDGLVLDHLCRNTSCCNPQHLEPVTQRVNLLRGRTLQAANSAKTHCKFGHEFTPENTYVDSRGRYCRTCRKRRNQESAARKRAASDV